MKLSDPFEKACWDYFNDNTQAVMTIHSNKAEDEFVPVKYFFRDIEKMPLLEHKALSLCSGKVLDIGAGTGCHSLILQSNGIDVTALESRQGLVNLMKARNLKKVVYDDIFNYQSRKFDTLLMLMNGIGLVGKLQSLSGFLEHSKTLLNKGGQVLFDSSDILYLYETEDGSFRIDLNEAYYGEVEYRFEYKKLKSNSFNWLFVDFNTLQTYAEEAGFRSEKIYEDENFNYLARLY